MDTDIGSAVENAREERIMGRKYMLTNIWDGEGPVNCPSCKTDGHEKDKNNRTLIATDYDDRQLMSLCYKCGNGWKRLPDSLLVGPCLEIIDVYREICECFKKE